MANKRDLEVAGIHRAVPEETRKKNKRKHTRRTILKYAAKVAAGAALWGAGGYLVGKAFGYTIKPVVDGIIGTSQRVKGAYNGVRKFIPFVGRQAPTPQVTRRGFLSSLVRMAYHHPVASGTIAGGTYGAGKYALGGMSKYLTDRQIAILKDENAGYKERLGVLEDYRDKLEGAMGERDAKVKYLEGELTKVNDILRQLKTKPSNLELAAGEAEVQEEPTETQKEALLAIGISGILISIGLSSSVITGGIIVGRGNFNQMFPLIIALFISSLTFILSGIKKRRKIKKRIKRRKTY